MTDEIPSIRHNDQALMPAAVSPSRPAAAELMTLARILAPDETTWPECWRLARYAVELCRRAAELTARR
jgi:hypothetical protein